MNVGTALQRYPITMFLKDDTRVTIRPLDREDKVALAQFFQRVPEEDRFYLKENVTAPEVIREWTEHIDLERTLPIIGVDDGKIVADATLHRSRAPARRHVGELRIVVDPDYRGKGLGSRLTQELVDIGKTLKLNKLFFELVERRESSAIRIAVQAGFEQTATLRGRVRDRYGSLQDLVIMELSLEDKSVQV